MVKKRYSMSKKAAGHEAYMLIFLLENPSYHPECVRSVCGLKECVCRFLEVCCVCHQATSSFYHSTQNLLHITCMKKDEERWRKKREECLTHWVLRFEMFLWTRPLESVTARVWLWCRFIYISTFDRFSSWLFAPGLQDSKRNKILNKQTKQITHPESLLSRSIKYEYKCQAPSNIYKCFKMLN